MAIAGDTFTVELKSSHLGWGEFRYTCSRPPIPGEGYIPIHKEFARRFNIYNSNHTTTGMGFNLFNCRSIDGLFSGVLKAAGCSTAGDIYAKQFEGNGDLKALGRWYSAISAQPGDYVRVTWISPTDIEIELIRN